MCIWERSLSSCVYIEIVECGNGCTIKYDVRVYRVLLGNRLFFYFIYSAIFSYSTTPSSTPFPLETRLSNILQQCLGVCVCDPTLCQNITECTSDTVNNYEFGLFMKIFFKMPISVANNVKHLDIFYIMFLFLLRTQYSLHFEVLLFLYKYCQMYILITFYIYRMLNAYIIHLSVRLHLAEM